MKTKFSSLFKNIKTNMHLETKTKTIGRHIFMLCVGYVHSYYAPFPDGIIE